MSSAQPDTVVDVVPVLVTDEVDVLIEMMFALAHMRKY